MSTAARYQYPSSNFAAQKGAYYRFPYQLTSYLWDSQQAAGWLTAINANLNNDGFCVVQLDPIDFTDGSPNYNLNTTRLTQLTNLLNLVKSNNFTTVPVKR